MRSDFGAGAGILSYKLILLPILGLKYSSGISGIHSFTFLRLTALGDDVCAAYR